MKNFDCTLTKMAMSNGESFPDDLVYVWSKEIEEKGILKAVKKIKSLHPSFKIDLKNIDKIDPYNYRVYITNDSNYYSDVRGFEEGFEVGLVYVMIRQFIFEDNDKEYGEKMFYIDGEWQK